MNPADEQMPPTWSIAEAAANMDIAQRVRNMALFVGGLSLAYTGLFIGTEKTVAEFAHLRSSTTLSCEATVAPSALEKVTALLNEPSPSMSSDYKRADAYLVQHPWLKQNKNEAHMLAEAYLRADMDTKYGVTTFDWESTYDRMFTAYHKDPHSVSVDTVNSEFKLANEFLAHYGVTVAMASPEDAKGDGGHATALNAQNSKNIGHSLLETVKQFGNMPLEYVNASDTDKILFEELPRPRPNEVTLAEVTSENTSPIYVNTRTTLETADIGHELGHKMRYRECGGSKRINKDAEYAALNKGVAYDDKNWGKTGDTAENFLEQRTNIVASIVANQNKPHSDKNCKAITNLEAKGEQDMFITRYAKSKLAEDQAEQIGRLTTDYNFAQAVNPALPTITKKSTELLTEMYSDLPGPTSYFIAMGKLASPQGTSDTKAKELACGEPTAAE